MIKTKERYMSVKIRTDTIKELLEMKEVYRVRSYSALIDHLIEIARKYTNLKGIKELQDIISAGKAKGLDVIEILKRIEDNQLNKKDFQNLLDVIETKIKKIELEEK